MTSSNDKYRLMQVDKQVTYTLKLDRQVFTIEDVSARVDEETGKQFFSLFAANYPEWAKPDRFTDVPIYKYAA